MLASLFLDAKAELLRFLSRPPGGGDAGKDRVRRFYPFSQGQRGCIGRSLAVMNYTTVAATLLGHFTFRLADEVGFLLSIIRSQILFPGILDPQNLMKVMGFAWPLCLLCLPPG